MKKFLSVLALSAIMYSMDAQTLRTPAPSPTQNLKQDFALSTVEVSYSRPAVKQRKIFGDLVPYGKVWRTGANQATTITFGEEITFGDKKVPAGKYGLLTIPNTGEWTVILSKQLDVTSPSAYKQDQDVARVTVKADEMPFAIESFMMVFDNITPSTMDLLMLWEKTAVRIPIKSDVDTKVMAQINDLMNKDNRPYFNSAMYYMNNGKDINQALTWFDKAIEQNPKGYWIYHQKANALAKLGKKQEAVTTANKSMELAKEAKNDDYVALNQKLLGTLK
jgi:tetratricopeptide (TPR) repeat protein